MSENKIRTLGDQALVNETGDDVRVLEVVVVVGAENVCRDGGGEVATELLVVGAVRGKCSVFRSLARVQSVSTNERRREGKVE
jgi:hypothetical protein